MHQGVIPELDRASLSVSALREKMAFARVAIIRGMFTPQQAERLADGVDRAFAAFDDPRNDPDWCVPFQSKSGTMSMTKGWLRDHGGVLAVNSPPMLDMMRQIYREAGLVSFVHDFLGEEPVLSSYKTTLRLTKPETKSVGWHQDGAFLGDDARVLNVWLALSHCGVDAPSLDIATSRKEQVVGAGEEGAAYEWSVSDARAAREAGDFETPVLAPGDAVVFDHLCLHRTSAKPATRSRRAIEAWFFAPPTLPKDYDSVPL